MWRDWKAGRPIVWLGHLALCPAAAIASHRHSILLFRFPLLRPSLALTHTHSLLYAWNTHAHLNYSFGVDESRPLAASGEGGYDDNLGTPTPLVRVRDDGHCGTYSQYMQSMYVGRTERPTGILSIAT